jgi:hypothetical protein
MNRDGDMKDRDESSRGMEILISDGVVKIKSTKPLRLGELTERRNRNSDSKFIIKG